MISLIVYTMKSPLHILAALSLSTLGFSSVAQAEDKKAPEVKKLGDSLYQIGKIHFDSSKAEIHIPTTLQHDKVIMEYVLTTNLGKVHETLLLTDISPFNLNVVFKLLNYQSSEELFPVLNKDYIPTDKLHTATEEQKQHSRFSMSASWKIEGEKFSYPLESLFLHTNGSGDTMPVAPWVYGGSYMHNGHYRPDINGDIIAILTDRTAIANYSGKTRHDDTLWVPNKKILPAIGTPIILTLKKINR